jgi:hypothetical protein
VSSRRKKSLLIPFARKLPWHSTALMLASSFPRVRLAHQIIQDARPPIYYRPAARSEKSRPLAALLRSVSARADLSEIGTLRDFFLAPPCRLPSGIVQRLPARRSRRRAERRWPNGGLAARRHHPRWRMPASDPPTAPRDRRRRGSRSPGRRRIAGMTALPSRRVPHGPISPTMGIVK